MMNPRWSAYAILAVLAFGLACGGLPPGAEDLALEERPPESPFTWALLMSWAALALGGGSAVLGIWIDRDRTRPVFFAAALSVLIATAICVGGLQGFLDEEDAIETRANLERMLDMVADLAETSGDPELAALVEGNAKRRRPRPEGARSRQDEAPGAEAAPTDATPAALPTEGAEATEDGATPAEGAAPAEGAPPTDGAGADAGGG